MFEVWHIGALAMLEEELEKVKYTTFVLLSMKNASEISLHQNPEQYKYFTFGRTVSCPKQSS